jgi:hypothetical protein
LFKGSQWDGLRCGARCRRTGAPCRNLAVKGSARCRMHGGRRQPGRKRQAAGPVLDWFGIRLLYVLGHGPGAIIRALPKRDGKPIVARQVIQRRAARENWSEQRAQLRRTF